MGAHKNFSGWKRKRLGSQRALLEKGEAKKKGWIKGNRELTIIKRIVKPLGKKGKINRVEGKITGGENAQQ